MKTGHFLIKKAFLTVCAIVTICNNVNAIMVSQSAISSRSRELAHQYLERNGFSFYTIPSKLLPEYEQKISDLTQELIRRLNYEGRSYADLTEIESAVQRGLDGFVSTLRTLVLSRDLDAKTYEIIQRIGKEKGVNTAQLPSSMIAEFNRKKQDITNALKTMMTTDGRTYVRLHEIEKLVHKELDPFFGRVESEKSNWFYNLFGFGNQTNQNTPPSNNSASSYTPSYASTHTSNAVDASAIDKKTLDICNKILQQQGINPDAIPARAVSDYSEKVQKTIKRVKNSMYYGQLTVSVYDIEAIAHEELQSVVDKIKFKGEICVICQDNYQSQERVGILNCGHVYHKDCIYAWLKTNKSCPLCRQKNVIVAKQENVP